MKKSLRLALAQVVSYTYNKTKQPILKKYVLFLFRKKLYFID